MIIIPIQKLKTLLPCKSRCHQTPIYMFCIFMPPVSRCSINARIEPSSSITWLLKILVFKTCLGSYFLYLLSRSQFQNDFTFITCFSSNGCKTNHPKILWCGTITYPMYMFCKFMQNFAFRFCGSAIQTGHNKMVCVFRGISDLSWKTGPWNVKAIYSLIHSSWCWSSAGGLNCSVCGPVHVGSLV